MLAEQLDVYTDANPQFWAMVSKVDGNLSASLTGTFDMGETNNSAELRAIYHALKFALPLMPKNIILYSDSKLAVNQLSEQWHIKNAKLREVVTDIWNLIGKHPKTRVRFQWISRKENPAGKLLG